MSNNKPYLPTENAKCSCKGFNLDKLLQPRILQLLNGGKMHGYGIVQALEVTPLFREEKADTAGIYRALSTLQERGLVDFEWILEASGPAKKEYVITENGKHCLQNWIQTLDEYIEALAVFVNRAKVMEE
jgi:PadR family transcriptional regulator, regulatory protein PadR